MKHFIGAFILTLAMVFVTSCGETSVKTKEEKHAYYEVGGNRVYSFTSNKGDYCYVANSPNGSVAISCK